MRRFSLGTEPYREMSESNLAIIAREFRNRGFLEDEEEDHDDNGTQRDVVFVSLCGHPVGRITCFVCPSVRPYVSVTVRLFCYRCRFCYYTTVLYAAITHFSRTFARLFRVEL